MSAHLARLHRGEIIVDIGQLTPDDRRELARMVRKGLARKWRGRWFPDPGAPWGMGPLKSCYAIEEVRS